MMKQLQAMLCVIVTMLLCYALAWAAPEDRGSFSWTKYTQSIPARDGGSISTFVYTTNAPGLRPLVVFRHGFSRSKNLFTKYGEHFASRGFVVILPDARSGLSPDYLGKDSDDMIDCANWAVQRSMQSGNYLSGMINPSQVCLGGHSAGGYTAEIAAYKNLAQGENQHFDCSVMMLFDPVPTDVGHAEAIAQSIDIPMVAIYAVSYLCNNFGAGSGIFQNTAGPSYGLYNKGADHCDAESLYEPGCAVMCLHWPFGGWDSGHNKTFLRYGTAMLEAYMSCDPAAYTYINGPAAQSDSKIQIYNESRGLDMPPAACQ
jgi:dienelactone hydrolase